MNAARKDQEARRKPAVPSFRAPSAKMRSCIVPAAEDPDHKDGGGDRSKNVITAEDIRDGGLAVGHERTTVGSGSRGGRGPGPPSPQHNNTRGRSLMIDIYTRSMAPDRERTKSPVLVVRSRPGAMDHDQPREKTPPRSAGAGGPQHKTRTPRTPPGRTSSEITKRTPRTPSGRTSSEIAKRTPRTPPGRTPPEQVGAEHPERPLAEPLAEPKNRPLAKPGPPSPYQVARFASKHGIIWRFSVVEMESPSSCECVVAPPLLRGTHQGTVMIWHES